MCAHSSIFGLRGGGLEEGKGLENEDFWAISRENKRWRKFFLEKNMHFKIKIIVIPQNITKAIVNHKKIVNAPSIMNSVIWEK